MKKIHVKVKYIEDVLGTSAADPELHSRFIASKASDAPKIEEEVDALGAAEIVERGMTVFPRLDDGTPFAWDYQWKGFFKESCKMLIMGTGYKSKDLKSSYKKKIDGLVFVEPRKIPYVLPDDEEIGDCQRPLRAETPKGERIALAHSETVPAGTTQEFDVMILNDNYVKYVEEWLEYGQYHGTMQWRNSGKGRFVVEEFTVL